MNFSVYADQVSIIDANHHVTLSTVDLAYTAVNFEETHLEGNP